MSARKKIARFLTPLFYVGLLACLVFIIGYGGLFVLEQHFPAHYGACDEYTKYLNGGTHEFKGKKLDITLCGRNGHFPEDGETVRLQVHSQDGQLLAKRYFTANWAPNANYRLEYYEDHLVYFDGDGHNDIATDKKILSMPPTLLDWIRARLPS